MHMWKTSDGREIPIDRLSDNHLVNVIESLFRRERKRRQRLEEDYRQAMLQAEGVEDIVAAHESLRRIRNLSLIEGIAASYPDATFIFGEMSNRLIEADAAIAASMRDFS